MQKLYNEGRAIGLSAYEIYLRQFLSNGGNPEDAPSEKDWLTYVYQSYRSLVFKINPSNIHNKYYDIPLPENSNLVANQQLEGYLFLGECETDSTGWATKIIDAGYVLSNSTSNPYGSPTSFNRVTESTHPVQFDTNTQNTLITDDIKNQLRSYAKIIDGGIICPQDWESTASGIPAKDLKPKLFNSKLALRLIFEEIPETSIYILITGFTDKTITCAISGLDGSTSTTNPKDGDFLGPEVYPWISKIHFTSPSVYMQYINDVIEDLDVDISGLSERIQHNADAIASIETDVSALSQRITTNAQNIQLLEQSVQQLDNKKQNKLTAANNTIVIDATNSTIKGNYVPDDGSISITGNRIKANLEGVTLESLGVTSTKTELNTLHNSSVTNADFVKLHGITSTVTELNYTDGVTSNIQTQLNGKSTIIRIKGNAGSFSAFDKNTGTVEFNVPTQTSHLTNNSGFITSAKLGSRVVLLDKEAVDGTTYFNFGVKYPLAQSITNFDFCAVSFRYDPNNEALNKNNYVGTSYVVRENYPDKVDTGTSDDYGTYQYVYAGNVADGTAIRYIRFAFPTAGEFWCKGNANVTLGNNKTFHVYVIGYKLHN